MSYGDLAVHDDRALWTLLYYVGYLTIQDSQFVVPNSEQRVDWIVPALSNPGEVEDLLKSLVSGDVEKFKREFESLTMECLSFHDVGGSEGGGFLPCILSGFVCCPAASRIQCQIQSGGWAWAV
ncbi:hypothetical protein BC938DRAFT_477378 [Jimgerdemannia flammicorona]|uniref:Uncharacterized protein n=1 Tax=Jimgerdemannia flammicorona TaxID=994334 RepID=A0A433QPE6_9FUNG|nr:hypothetical protein BC938DRAFT_477378 [Jimgerdemannia flammicorona]